jgi:hypothetical protein
MAAAFFFPDGLREGATNRFAILLLPFVPVLDSRPILPMV